MSGQVQPQRIREARLGARLTQEQLAEKIGTRARNIVRWEKTGGEGAHEPRSRYVAAIAVATGKDVAFFFQKDEQADDDSEAARMPSLSIDELLRLRISEIVAEQIARAVTA